MDGGDNAPGESRVIRLADVQVGDVIGSGALGEVRRGTIGDVGVALKALHMLRTDAAAQALQRLPRRRPASAAGRV